MPFGLYFRSITAASSLHQRNVARFVGIDARRQASLSLPKRAVGDHMSNTGQASFLRIPGLP